MSEKNALSYQEVHSAEKLDIVASLRIILDGSRAPASKWEPSTPASIISNLAKVGGYDVALYGAGVKGYYGLRQFRAFGTEPAYIVDANPALAGADFYGKSIMNLDAFRAAMKTAKRPVIAVVTVMAYGFASEKRVIDDFLMSAGCKKIFGIEHWGIQTCNGYWAHKILRRTDEFIDFFHKLGDRESQEVYHEFMRATMHDDLYRRPELPSTEKYFGKGIFELGQDESFLNCGMDRGDSLLFFMAKYPRFARLYGIESNHCSCLQAADYFSCLSEEITEKIEIHCAWLGGKYGITLDSLLAEKPITLIALDIEGGESDALEASRRVIAEQEPILALSAYHLPSDLLELPALVSSIVPHYRFYLRKYHGSAPSANIGEMVLYAVPPKRLCHGQM